VSSAGRGERIGGEFDWYPSPSWTVRRFLEAWSPRPGTWVEPSAGEGAIIRATDGHMGSIGKWIACEIREDARPHLEALVKPKDLLIGDWLRGDFGPAMDERLSEATLCIGNPPYIEAAAFIAKCFERCPNADIALLLRVGIVETPERSEFLRACCPDVYALPNRPSFNPPTKGKKLSTDSATYAWFLWTEANADAAVGTFQVLAQTPLEERKRR
jgi:hypothetical protein